MDYTPEELRGLMDSDDAESLVTDIVTWEHEGQLVVGKLLSVEPFTEGDFETEVNKYILKSASGPVSCVLGAAADKALGDVDKLKGRVLGIEYKGKKQLKDGKQVNVFRIVDLSKKVKM